MDSCVIFRAKYIVTDVESSFHPKLRAGGGGKNKKMKARLKWRFFLFGLKWTRNQPEILYVKDDWDIRATNERSDCNFE